MRPAADGDEWGALQYQLLAQHGIKPWEFGELTWSWCMNILRKGKSARAEATQAWAARKALALAKAHEGDW